jgi:hypothetical protein
MGNTPPAPYDPSKDGPKDYDPKHAKDKDDNPTEMIVIQRPWEPRR